MCGIFGHYVFNGHLSRKQILDLVFCGLHRLEYRGYDSAGLSIQSEADDENAVSSAAPIIIKSKGNIPALEHLTAQMIADRRFDVDLVFQNHVAISHTRWATHGEPSPENSHPITSGPEADFTVVHNGIITNFAKLKAFLVEEGQQFATETDTEVIPKLCALIHSTLERPLPLSQLVMQVLRKLDGAYAILVQSRHYPGELVCCRKGSPVVFAVKNTKGAQLRRFRTSMDLSGGCFEGHPLECFIASDDKAIIEHTQARSEAALRDPPPFCNAPCNSNAIS